MAVTVGGRKVTYCSMCGGTGRRDADITSGHCPSCGGKGYFEGTIDTTSTDTPYMTAEDADRVITSLISLSKKMIDVLAQRDDLQAQLNARIDEIRDVVEERDEARVLARRMAQFAIAITPLHSQRCIFCDTIGRYTIKTGSYADIHHAEDCPLKVMEGWNNEQD
jgi:hypothetical protein